MIRNFHALCKEWCDRAAVDFPIPAGGAEAQEFWDTQAPELLLMALDDVPDRFDAVVVDEAQDFHANWWPVIEELERTPGGPMYIFFDRAQNLYGADLQFPRTGTRYDLDINCRNTRRIAEACGRVVEHAIQVHPSLPRVSGPRSSRAVRLTRFLRPPRSWWATSPASSVSAPRGWPS